MKKNFFKFLLLGVIGLSLGAVSCKDYDDDIKGLNNELAELKRQLQEANDEMKDLDFATDDDVDRAVAAAKEQVMEEAQEAIDRAIEGIESGPGGGLTEAEVKALIASEIAPKLAALALQSDLVALADRVRTNEEALAMQAAALEKYDYESFEDLIKEIKDLDGGAVTPEELKELMDKINEIEPKLNVLNGVLGSLKNLYYLPEWKDNGSDAIAFLYLNAIENVKVNPTTTFVLSSRPWMTFRVNPTNASIDGIGWDFLNRDILVTRADGDHEDLVDVVEGTMSFVKGSIKFRATGDPSKRLNRYRDGSNTKFDYPNNFSAYTAGDYDNRDSYFIAKDAGYATEQLNEIAEYYGDFIALRASAGENKEEIVSDDIKTWFKQTYAFIGDPIRYAEAQKGALETNKPFELGNVTGVANNGPVAGINDDDKLLRYFDYSRDLKHLKGTKDDAGTDTILGTDDDEEDSSETNSLMKADNAPEPPFYPLDSISHKLPYAKNGRPATYDLNDYVMASVWDIQGGMFVPHTAGIRRILIDSEEADIDGYHFKFTEVNWNPEEPTVVPAKGDDTNQAFFVNFVNGTTVNGVTSSNDGKIVIAHGSSAINRTPIFMVELMFGDKPMARHWIKFQITEEPKAPITIDPIILKDIPYLDLYATKENRNGLPGVPMDNTLNSDASYSVNTQPDWDHKYNLRNEIADGRTLIAYDAAVAATDEYREGEFAEAYYFTEFANRVGWQFMNTQIYQELGLSHEQFRANYQNPKLSYAEYPTNDTEVQDGKNKLLLADKGWLDFTTYFAGPNTGTVPMKLYIHPETRFGDHTWYITYSPKAASVALLPEIKIPIKFKLLPPPTPKFRADYVANIGTDPLASTIGKFMTDPTIPAYTAAGEQYYMQATLSESFENYMMDWTRDVVLKIVPMLQTGNNPMYRVASATGITGTTPAEVELRNAITAARNGLAPEEWKITGYQAHLFSFRRHDGIHNAASANIGQFSEESDVRFNDDQIATGVDAYLAADGYDDGLHAKGWKPNRPHVMAGSYYTGKNVYVGDAIDDTHDTPGNTPTITYDGVIDDVTAPTWSRGTRGEPYLNEVFNYLGQDIKVNTDEHEFGIDEDQWTFLVNFRSTYENMEDIDVDWKFRFINPIVAWLDEIVLSTEGEPDVKRLDNYLHVNHLAGNAQIIIPGDPNVPAQVSSTSPTAADINAQAMATLGVSNNPNIPNTRRYGFLKTGDNPSGVMQTREAIAHLNWNLHYDKTGDATAVPIDQSGISALYLSNVDDNIYVNGHTTNYYYIGDGTATTPGVNQVKYHSIFWQNAGTGLLQDFVLGTREGEGPTSKVTDAPISVDVAAGYPVPYATRNVKGTIRLKKTTSM